MDKERDGRCGRRQAAIQRARELGLASWLTQAARADASNVARRLVSAIEASGGVRMIEDNGARVLSPVMAPEWHDLGTLYLAACIAAGDVPHVDDTLDTSGALTVLRAAGWHCEYEQNTNPECQSSGPHCGVVATSRGSSSPSAAKTSLRPPGSDARATDTMNAFGPACSSPTMSSAA